MFLYTKKRKEKKENLHRMGGAVRSILEWFSLNPESVPTDTKSELN